MRNDSYIIQEMIDGARAGGEECVTIPRINPETKEELYSIGSTVLLPSDMTVILDGCCLRLCDGAVCNIFASVGAWEAPDGENVVRGIKNVRIIGQNGARFEGGRSNGRTEKCIPEGEHMMWNSFVYFRNVDGFEICGIKACEPRYWCFTFVCARNGKIHDIDFHCENTMPNQDGIDLRGGCHNIDIYNISGVTGDDTIALTNIGKRSSWWSVQGVDSGEIANVTIRNVRAGCSGGHSIIRLLANDGNKVKNVTIKDVYDTSIVGEGISCYAVIRIGDVRYFAVSPQGLGDIDQISIENVTSGSAAVVYVNNDNITQRHVSFKGLVAEKGELLRLKNKEKFYSEV